MAQFQSSSSPTPFQPVQEREEAVPANIANPAPLGLGVMAFATAVLGCFYTGFIIPYETAGSRIATGATLLITGIILILAGMWAYRKNYMVHATTFTSYGGFLAVLGVIFMPNFGITGALSTSGALYYVLGLLFLCWTIFTGVLILGALRTSLFLVATTLVLFVAYLLLTIGALAGNNYVLIHIGGWLAIATAVIAWLAMAASITSARIPQAAFSIPLGRRLVLVE
ncbi:MAG TPA: acetate uptake transporter [Ktedonobacteraceae bacterium]|nr:acetate uptake transporter [Ktedonobacteraceae bacterium]